RVASEGDGVACWVLSPHHLSTQHSALSTAFCDLHHARPRPRALHCGPKGTLMKSLSAFLVLLFLLVTPLAAQTASGTFTANGKKTPLDHVVAARDKDGNVHVLLTNEAVSADQLLSHAVEFDLAGKGNFSGVQVEFDKSGQIISGSFYSPTFTKMNGSFSASGMHKFEGKVTAASAEGKLWMEKPDDFFDNTYFYTAKFSAPIGGPSKPAPAPALKGKPLPSDGGEPAKAYRAYLKTI